MLSILFLSKFISQAGAVSPRWSFVEAYQYIDDGNWYRGENNSEALLAWGESYVMSALASMSRTTRSPEWLDQLAWHADAVLEQRDDNRGVMDYRGVSEACWQNLHYQSGLEPYCYVVHTGMLIYPMLEFARIVESNGLEDEMAYDGQRFGDKATAYVIAAQQSVDAHEEHWDPDGFYFFRDDAFFLSYPGRDVPLNMSNAMGRSLLVLYDLTGEQDYLAKATAMAIRFQNQITDHKWNYWGGEYVANGEDISHASINVDFAAMCAERGIIFDEDDMKGIADNFMNSIYIDDSTFSDWVGGGTTNNSSYRPQLGRWLRLTPWKTGVYTAVRDLFEEYHPPPSVSASILVGWAMLAEFEPQYCEHFFYYVDWDDPEPNIQGNMRVATAYSANILITPPNLGEGCIAPLTMELEQQITMGQWDGESYHRIAEWKPLMGTRFLPYEPEWSYIYWSDGVLFQFTDAAYTGEGISIQESPGIIPPIIISEAPATGMRTDTMEYQLEATGAPPFWWSLTNVPTGARIDAKNGLLVWTPVEEGTFTFTVILENNWGSTEQTFSYMVVSEETEPSQEFEPAQEPSQEDSGDVDPETDENVEEDEMQDDSQGCGCSSSSTYQSQIWLFMTILGVVLQRRKMYSKKEYIEY